MSDGELTQYIHCEIELNLAGPTEKVVHGWTVKALREIADKLERDEYVSDHHDVFGAGGRKIGNAYFDFSEGHHIDDRDGEQ